MDPRDVYYSDTRARNIFGYRVSDDSMSPIFRRGDIAVVNPNLPAGPGDYVVARSGDETLLREISLDGNLLEAIEPDCLALPKRDCLILGRVVESKRRF